MKKRHIELALSGLRESQLYMTKGTDQYHETEEAIQYLESLSLTPNKGLTAEEQNSNQFDLGYAVACATFLQQYDQPTMVKTVYYENFCSIERLKEIGAEPVDIGTLWQIAHELSAPQEQKGGQK